VVFISVCCRLAARSVEIDQLRAEKSALEQHLAEQQSKAAEDESRNADAIAKMKNGFQLAENAVIERDQVGLLVHLVNRSCCAPFSVQYGHILPP